MFRVERRIKMILLETSVEQKRRWEPLWGNPAFRELVDLWKAHREALRDSFDFVSKEEFPELRGKARMLREILDSINPPAFGESEEEVV
jgi:hypothetical protein